MMNDETRVEDARSLAEAGAVITNAGELSDASVANGVWVIEALSAELLDGEAPLSVLKAVALDAEDADEPEEPEVGLQDALFSDAFVEKIVREPIFAEEQMIEAAFQYHRERGFPYRDISLAMCMLELNKLRSTEGKALISTRDGYKVADVFHRHRMHARANGMKSPLDAFKDDKKLRKAITLELKLAGKPRVWAGGILTLVNGTQACSNFRPGFAAYLYREFAPDDAIVLDTSTGYGGRLLGAIASGKVQQYVGFDPNKETHDANKRMMQALGFKHFAVLYNMPIEDLPEDEIVEYCDFAFTSPPYFAKELYAQDDTQSWVRYKTGEEWRDKFLAAMMKRQFIALKSGCFAIVNIADVKLKKQTYPLVEWCKESGVNAGFEYVRTEQFPMMTRFGANMADEVATEPVLIFKKG
jgi:hypothetical protein